MLRAMQLGARIRIAMGNSRQRLGQLGQAVSKLGQRLKGAKDKFDKLQQAAQGATAVSSAVAAAFGFAAFKAVSFEKQMSAVQAVLLLSKEEMSDLNKLAQSLGSTTSFSATEAAQGMEFFARAGFNTKQIMDGLPSVLNAAAAEGMDLATASSIVANVIKGLGLEASDAGTVADTLALASARTNTSIVGLGEGLKYAAATARQAGVPMHEVVGAVAALQDMGLKGSMAGTSLSIMMTKMATVGGKAEKSMKRLGISFKDQNGNLLPLRQQLIQLQKGFQKAGGTADKLALANELFGARGQKAALGLVNRFSDANNSLEDLFAQLENANGSAAKMSSIRLDNLAGQVTLLMSALEGVAIAGFGGINSAGSSLISTITEFFSKMGAGMRGEAVAGFAADFGKGVMAVANSFRNMIGFVMPVLSKFKEMFEEAFGAGSAGMLGAVTAAVSAIVAAITPVLVIGGGVAAVVAFLGEALVPVIYAAGALAAIMGGGIAAASGEGVSASGGFFQTLVDGFQGVMNFVGGLFTVVKDNFDLITSAFGPAFSALGRVLSTLGETIGALFGQGTSGAKGFGETLGMIIVVVANLVGHVSTLLLDLMAVMIKVASGFIKPIVQLVGDVLALFSDLINGSISLKDAFIGVFRTIGNIIILPIRMAILGIMNLIQGILETELVKKALAVAGIDMGQGLQGAITTVENFGRNVNTQNSNDEFANEAKKALVEKSRTQAAATAPEINVQNVVENKSKVTIKNDLKVSGKGVALANSEQELELSERAGFSNTSWQKRQILERGVKVVN